MKFGAGKSLPVSVAVWLEQQLEGRGIDSAPVYSHYILDLLHHDFIDLNEIPLDLKSSRNGRKKENSSTEVTGKSAVVEYLSAACHETTGLDGLVDELIEKLKAASDQENENSLIDKTSATGVLTLKQSSPTSASKYRWAFPPLGPKNSSCESSNFKSCLWPKNRNKDSDALSKENRSSKRRDSNKENLVVRGRMRSRSMVKQQGGVSHRSRNTAKSLDRKDERSTPKFSKGKHLDIKNRKCPTHHSFEEPDIKRHSRTPCAQENFGDISEFLPMDFQQLLQSPEDGFPKPCHPRQASDFSNFIQCGTNIISSIWSEKMEEEAFPEELPLQWEVKRNGMKSVPWSAGDDVGASTSWKMPLDFGTLMNNNNTCSINNNNSDAGDNNNFKKGNYWSDVETTSLALKDDVCYFSCLGDEAVESASDNSLVGRFTEARPKPPVKSPKKKPAVYTYKQTISDQEEDLLTSTKTHFKPIKQEASEPADHTSGTKYEDGTCFSVSSSLEKVNFQRSESGSLYLGPDQKYMEYKPDRETPETSFVPKFKVNLNEKFCQTDDTSRDALEDKGEGFFFPEDEQLAEDMVNSIIDDDEEESRPTITLQGFLTTWPVGTSDIWSNNATYDKKSWMLGNSWNGNLSLDPVDGREHYMRLRNELSQDGEELLSDLSSIHLFIDSEHLPDSKVHYPKRMRFRPCSFHNRNVANESLA